MTKVLITGVLGLFGAHTSRFLLDKGYEVIGIDDRSGGYTDYLDKRVEFIDCDTSSRDWLHDIWGEDGVGKIDYVIHYSAYASEGLSDYIKHYNYRNNVIASINIINACINKNVKKLLFTSSMSVYGAGKTPFKEGDVLKPVDSYALAKKLVEDELELSGHKFGLQYSIIRPHNVISPTYQNYADKYRNVLALWANSIVNGGDINVYGEGLGTRSFSDIKFMLPIVEKLLTEHNGETFNIGSDQPITILAAAQKTQRIANDLGYQPKIQHLEERMEVKHAYSDHTKAQNLLGFKDETDLDQVIKDLLVWVASQPKRDVRIMDYEITKNLYSFWK